MQMFRVQQSAAFQHRRQSPHRISSTTESEQVDRIARLIAIPKKPIRFDDVAPNRHADCSIELFPNETLPGPLSRRIGARPHASVVVGNLSCTTLQHAKKPQYICLIPSDGVVGAVTANHNVLDHTPLPTCSSLRTVSVGGR